ncbi:hypothetical protein [Cohnella sp. WQ 127256]|uniref:hypothetical protein n=1 Tax=Cohnella sp. WQ 127256 TaxID=2938790 RepID=UPI0021180DA7|nr:hypothetical protein [Cohnella sp. WQ 127256]
MKNEFNSQLVSVLRYKIGIHEFEHWIYENDFLLEEELGKDLYFKLINLNYKSKYVFEDLETLLITILEYSSIEEFRIQDTLNRLVYIEEDFISSCREIYREYCDGFSFLRMIALKYIVYDYDFQLENAENRNEFIQGRHEYVEEGKRFLNFFNNGKIKIIGEQDYIDLRSIEERIEEKYWT